MLLRPLSIAVLAATTSLLAIGNVQAAATVNVIGTSDGTDLNCLAEVPTIYVENGIVVGGPLDGETYAGQLVGTSGADVIFGTDGVDNVDAAGGNDVICTFQGDDEVAAGGGADTVYGGGGADRLRGQGGADSLFGGSGADRLLGGPGNDTLLGGARADRLFGGNGDDTLNGGSGADRLFGSTGDDILNGEQGADRLFGGTGDDRLDGGPSQDRLFAGRGTDECADDGQDQLVACETDLTDLPGGEPVVIAVPDLAALSQGQAEEQLAALGLRSAVTFEFNSQVASGLVFFQTEDAGAEVAPNTLVVLVVSQGPAFMIEGRVTAVDGQLLSGIFVFAQSDDSDASTPLATTDADGEFSLEVNPGTDYSLALSADNFADQIVTITPPATNGRVALDITMVERAPTQSFNSEGPASVSGVDGAQVTLEANSFAGVNGEDVNVSITPIDVSDLNVLEAFPGEFTGIDDNNQDGPIVPLGTVEFVFTDQDGNELELADGVQADITIPLYIDQYPDGVPVFAGDSIPIWSLNEQTGIWEQEGTGTAVADATSPSGLAVNATVNHFSWWNVDINIDQAVVEVNFFDVSSGTAMIEATTDALPNWVGRVAQSSPVSVPGSRSVVVPAGTEVCFSARLFLDNELAAGEVLNATTNEVCATFSSAGGSVSLVANSAGVLTSLSSSLGDNSPLNVNAVSGFTFNRLTFTPDTAEQSVTYGASGTLPPGLELRQIDAIRAEIVGRPTTEGEFTATVTGTDSDGNASQGFVVNFSVNSGAAPEESIVFLPFAGPLEIDFFDEDFELFRTDFELDGVIDPAFFLGGPQDDAIIGWQFDPALPGDQVDLEVEDNSFISVRVFTGDIPSLANYTGDLVALLRDGRVDRRPVQLRVLVFGVEQ